jgi:hypothetical protein
MASSSQAIPGAPTINRGILRDPQLLSPAIAYTY